jgi:hypothetical protein
VLTLCSLCWERERMCCWLEAVKLLESRSCRMMVELLVAEDAVGVDHDPESRQIVSCYCLETINKNEGDSGDDRVGGCWGYERSGEKLSALRCDTCELVRTNAKVSGHCGGEQEVFTFVATFDQQDCLSRHMEAGSPLQLPSLRRWMRACSVCRCTSRRPRRDASEGYRSTP